MKSVIALSLLASAAAFAPAVQQQSFVRASVATNMAFEDELGAQPPLADVRNGFAAFQDIQSIGIAQIVGFVGLLEIAVMKDITGGEFVGDFRNEAIDFGWDTFDEETKLSKRAIELNNGRAAQMGILALMVHEQLGVSLIPN